MSSISRKSAGVLPTLAVTFTSPILQQHQVVPVHDLAAVVMAESLFDAVRAKATDTEDLVGSVIGDSAGDSSPIAIEDRHSLAALEGALHILHARRQQAAPGLTQDFCGAAVDYDASLHGQAREHPALAALHARDGGGKERADWLAGGEAHKHVGLPAGRDNSVGAATYCEAGGLELGGHPADAGAFESASGQRFDSGVDAVHALDQL